MAAERAVTVRLHEGAIEGAVFDGFAGRTVRYTGSPLEVRF